MFLIGLRIKNSGSELCAGACHKDVVEKLRDKPHKHREMKRPPINVDGLFPGRSVIVGLGANWKNNFIDASGKLYSFCLFWFHGQSSYKNNLQNWPAHIVYPRVKKGWY